MKSKKLLLLLLAVPLIGAPAVRAETPPSLDGLFEPAPELRLRCSQCVGSFTTSPGGGQASHWGLGSSCTAAANDLEYQLLVASTSDCENRGYMGACNQQVVTVGSCWWSSQYQKYVRDGYMNYSCKTFGPECQD